MTILVTGGCGFIGSNFIRNYSKWYSDRVVNVDLLTYAGNQDNISDVRDNYKFYLGDIADRRFMEDIIKTESPDMIFNFAAESHVDNSITDSMPFLKTNVLGTANLLECVKSVKRDTRFVHISTDEVYGSLGPTDPAFTENTPYSPRSPYSASKAASDHFVMAYHHTHGLDTIITNCSNNYGRNQHPEKFIPTIIRKVLFNAPIPVYGNGSNVRDWIHVDDHCSGIVAAASHGISGEKYNFGGENQISNIDLVYKILGVIGADKKLISYVVDRLGHDFRYDIDNTKSRTVLGWKPQIEFDDGLNNTIAWYMNNTRWVEQCLRKHSGSY
ncbi:RfbB dTDP-D-glucose 4,6-dehydratase [uncultured Caudovirales phage]|uniref:RfbB dTDP-D-glucose 4,6-dehydratase n=1 Tax=uncultured Caudovirales phage TaxID=2100421 RepID=A0A6J5KPL2_9CAUD|nr:RfbB dTDP-D-glucose 4,6-dehydratase [uncultured Caudovirales phage]